MSELSELSQIQQTLLEVKEELASMNIALRQIANNLVSLREELGASKTPELISNVAKTLDQRTKS